MNKITTLSRERLESLIDDEDCRVTMAEQEEMASVILSAMDTPNKPELTVYYKSMPESNGKENWTAILMTKGGNFHDGMTIDRSEYPGRVLWAADRVRWLIGEKKDRPYISDYDHEKRSSYVYPKVPHAELLKVAVALREYIDALPKDVVASLPTMPGMDRDWVDETILHARAALFG